MNNEQNASTKNNDISVVTPKFKIGDDVWAVMGTDSHDTKIVIAHVKIAGVLYQRGNGVTKFNGYQFGATPSNAICDPTKIFETLEEAERYADENADALIAKSKGIAKVSALLSALKEGK